MKKSIFNNIRIIIILTSLFLSLPTTIVAQGDTSKASAATDTTGTTTEAPATEEESTLSPGIDFSCLQKLDVISLTAKVQGKLNGSLTKLHGLKIEFFVTTDAGDTKIGEAITNMNGVATVDCKDETAIKSADGKIHFKASYAGNKGIDPAEEVVAVRRAKIIVTPIKEDSSYSLQLKLVDASTGTEKPLPEVALGIFAKRMFSNLKIGEGTTDANGEATVEVPNNLPGNATGELTLLARLDDNEEYGNLETAVNEKWGVPVSNKLLKQERSLFSHNPPIWMLITFIILMVTVWGHYFIIVYQLFKLKKEQ